MTPEISKALAELANKLGTSVEYLWPMMVKHEFVTSVTCLVVYTILSIVLFCASYKCLKELRDGEDMVGAMLLSFVAGFAFSALAIVQIPDIIVPEAAAIKSLLAK